MVGVPCSPLLSSPERQSDGARPVMETTEIKVEVELEDSEEPRLTKISEDQPLALVKRRERDITERFPYIDEVTTTTTTPGNSDDLVETEELADTPDDTVTSSVDKGEGLLLRRST